MSKEIGEVAESAETNDIFQNFPEVLRANNGEELIAIIQEDPKLALKELLSVTAFHEEVTRHLKASEWEEIKCLKCSKDYLAKGEKTMRCPQCRPPKEFLDLGERNKIVGHNQLAAQTVQHFSTAGYQEYDSFPMVPEHGNTLFTVAGVQIINPHIFSGSPFDETKRFILQPSIRLQTMNDTRSCPGCSTAFVNAVTLEGGSNLNRHLQHFETWLNYFSAIGIHIKDLRAKLRFNLQNWGLGNSLNYNIDLYFGGLSLFNASYFHEMPTSTGKPVNISDMGITLERTLWMLNKSPSYFDNIGPSELALREKDNEADAIRTAVLMIGSNIAANSKDGKERMRSKKLRSLIRKTASHGAQLNITQIVNYFYDYWSSYIKLPVSKEAVREVIQFEHQRCVNQFILEKLDTKRMGQHVDLDTHTFIRKLLDERIATREQIAIILS